MVVTMPGLAEERLLWEAGYRIVAGVDEAGRGPLAGPVAAAAVVLHTDIHPEWVWKLKDSKALTAKQRDSLSACIIEESVAHATALVDNTTIDEVGIVAATRLAMCMAVEQLGVCPEFLLIDHVRLARLNMLQKSIVKGDCLCLSIAAASVLAKVARDHAMVELDELHPGYGFARNKGYGTSDHLEALRSKGPSPIHRRTFSPIRELFEWRLL